MKTCLRHSSICLLLWVFFVTTPTLTLAAQGVQPQGCVMRRQSVGVLLTEATLANVEYLQRYRDFAEHGKPGADQDEGIRQAFIASAQPLLAVQQVNASLQRQFAAVTLYDSLDAVMAAHPDVIVVIDANSRLISRQNTVVRTRVQAQFFDSGFTFMGQAQGASDKDLAAVWNLATSPEQVAQQVEAQQAVQLDAFKRFDASVQAWVDSHSHGALTTAGVN